jgi:hypothetical protein
VKFSNTRKFDSKVCEGVSFTIRVMTEGVAARLRLRLAEAQAKMQDVQRELAEVNVPRLASGDVDPEATVSFVDIVKLNSLSSKVRTIRKGEVDPVYFETCFVRVAGLEIEVENEDGSTSAFEGRNITRDIFKENAPNDLFEEVVERIRREIELTNEERRNLESPTTSAAEAGGPTSDSTADSAETTNSTESETADGSSPS